MNFLSSANAKDRKNTAGKLAVFFLICLFGFSSCSAIDPDNQEKEAFYDPAHRVIWWATSHNNSPAIKAVKSGSTARLNNDVLKERFDAANNSWDGYKEFVIDREKE